MVCFYHIPLGMVRFFVIFVSDIAPTGLPNCFVKHCDRRIMRCRLLGSLVEAPEELFLNCTIKEGVIANRIPYRNCQVTARIPLYSLPSLPVAIRHVLYFAAPASLLATAHPETQKHRNTYGWSFQTCFLPRPGALGCCFSEPSADREPNVSVSLAVAL